MSDEHYSVFDGTIGMRIRNKLIEHAYGTGYQGTDKKLQKSIDDLENVIRICKESIADVIHAEVEVMSLRESYRKMEGHQESPLITGFIGGLIHAREIVEIDASVIGKFPLE